MASRFSVTNCRNTLAVISFMLVFSVTCITVYASCDVYCRDIPQCKGTSIFCYTQSCADSVVHPGCSIRNISYAVIFPQFHPQADVAGGSDTLVSKTAVFCRRQYFCNIMYSYESYLCKGVPNIPLCESGHPMEECSMCPEDLTNPTDILTYHSVCEDCGG